MPVEFELDDERVTSERAEPTIGLTYPRLDGTAKAIRVMLLDVRAANQIRVSYDFDRDGWSIQVPTRTSWHEGEPVDEALKEAAFVPAWAHVVDLDDDKDAAPATPTINVVVRSPEPSPAIAVWIRMNKVHGAQMYDYRAFQPVLERLARKDADALERALVAYENDAWVRKHPSRATPAHLLRDFDRYAAGTP